MTNAANPGPSPEEAHRAPSKVADLLAALEASVAAAKAARAARRCTCEDLTTPAYPEFAAVARDPDCPTHSDKGRAT